MVQPSHPHKISLRLSNLFTSFDASSLRKANKWIIFIPLFTDFMVALFSGDGLRSLLLFHQFMENPFYELIEKLENTGKWISASIQNWWQSMLAKWLISWPILVLKKRICIMLTSNKICIRIAFNMRWSWEWENIGKHSFWSSRENSLREESTACVMCVKKPVHMLHAEVSHVF